jgi:hypothetical protein
MIDSPLWDFDESRSAIAGHALSAWIGCAGNSCVIGAINQSRVCKRGSWNKTYEGKI